MYIIAGLYRHQKLLTPKGEQTRPTTSRLREALFNICQGWIEGARVLDLFAGSGAIGLEALSRGAQSATFIDSNREAIRCLQQNVAKLNAQPQCQILQGQVFTLLPWLEKQHKQFDIIFADPPYKKGEDDDIFVSYSEKLVLYLDKSPLLAPDGVLFIEEHARYQPYLQDLSKLYLVDSRQMSHSALQRYKWKTD